MAKVTVYNNAVLEMAEGTLNFPDSDPNTIYKIALEADEATSTYAPVKSQTTLTAIKALGSNPFVELTGGVGGYTAGGAAIPSIVTDLSANNIRITFADTSWAAASFTASGAAIYNSVTDKLVAHIDFEGNVVASANTFTIDFTTPLIISNNA